MSAEDNLLEETPIKSIYQYTGEVMHVYKKNMIAVNIDLGFATWRRVPVTLANVIVPEENGSKFKELLDPYFIKNKKVLIRGFGYFEGIYRCDLFSANTFPDIYYNNLVIKEGIGHVK